MHTPSAGLHSFAFPPAHVLQPLSSRKTIRKSAPFRAGVFPYPPHYRAAFAFSGFFCPHRHRLSLLRSALPLERRRYGLSSRRAALLPPAPPRTVHESFPSHGSSLSKVLWSDPATNCLD